MTGKKLAASIRVMARRWVALVAFAASAQGWLWSSFGATEEAAPAGAYGEGTVARLSEVRAGEALAGVLASSGALVVGVEDPEDAVGAVAEAAFGAFSAGAGLGAWRAYAARTESERCMRRRGPSRACCKQPALTPLAHAHRSRQGLPALPWPTIVVCRYLVIIRGR